MQLVKFISIVLLSGSLTSAITFKPSTICVDLSNIIIRGPESDDGFTFGDNYIYLEKIPPLSKASPIANISYSPTYASQDFNVFEEVVDNFKNIGDKPGTHWVTCVLQRNVTHITLPTQTSTWKKVFTVWAALTVPCITTTISAASSSGISIPTGTSYSFVWKNRDRIANIHTFDPATGTDGVVELPALSDIPALKRIINITSTGTTYTSDNCLASAYVIMGSGDSDPWNKPVIVSDGFDPRERISIQELLENVENSLAPNAYQFVQTITAKGYDLVFVDPGNGGKDITANARVVLKVIEEVCARSTGTVMVGGYSMGGLIARTALLLGEKNNLPCMSKISRYLSIDSPHLGAQINYDMQKKVIDISNTRLSNPISYLSYEKVATIAYDLKCTAARQLLFSHAITGVAEHDAFYSFLQTLGNYPQKAKRFAIGDAAWIKPYPGIDPGTGAVAATSTGTTMRVKGDDLAIGAYIDLWASGDEAISNGFPSFGSFSTINFAFLKDQFGPLTVYQPSSTHYGDTRFKPTFIPLYSALGINKTTFEQLAAPTNQTDLDKIAATNSPFNKVFLVNFVDRPKHIDFNGDMADKVMKTISRVDMTAILQLLLD